jgi:uncharacterized membrane protein YuzA (DUF378 family)
MKVINFISLVLILVGAINWGLWGFFQFDFITWVFGGDQMWLTRAAYALIGLSGVWGLNFLGKCKCL